MTTLLKQLTSILPPQMLLPSELLQLYQWVEDNGLIEEYDGFLYGRISNDWENTPDITLTASYQSSLKYWFDIPEIANEIASRLVIFAKSGMDSSMLGIWIDDDNCLKYVHLGSGSGSTLCCVIANSTIEFLTLISIGYRELGFVSDFTLTPEENGDEPQVNQRFIDWLKDNFNIKSPSNGANIVKNPAQLWDDETTDNFCAWCKKQIAKK
ncbi:hypothetical protein [Aeromonas cavernicola]|uniref:SMI1/KNR4 family protein n=1 Tax=Aeromonas cavernicola TaxID=1006623 RepID=A0A2H9U2J1_9GAMM|nr:hypothetical protein [Aeromonas cavernicola]PJG58220.1 hypothetical protein CUC53_13780 [Aeromonas cavernicola]